MRQIVAFVGVISAVAPYSAIKSIIFWLIKEHFGKMVSGFVCYKFSAQKLAL
jgi:hypothetical protein